MLNYTSDILIKRLAFQVMLMTQISQYVVACLIMDGHKVNESQSRIVNRDGKVISEWSHQSILGD